MKRFAQLVVENQVYYVQVHENREAVVFVAQTTANRTGFDEAMGIIFLNSVFSGTFIEKLGLVVSISTINNNYKCCYVQLFIRKPKSYVIECRPCSKYKYIDGTVCMQYVCVYVRLKQRCKLHIRVPKKSNVVVSKNLFRMYTYIHILIHYTICIIGIRNNIVCHCYVIMSLLEICRSAFNFDSDSTRLRNNVLIRCYCE